MKSFAIFAVLATISSTFQASAQLSRVHHNSVSATKNDNEWGRIGKNKNQQRTLRGSRRRLAKSEKVEAVLPMSMSMSMPELEEFGLDFESSMSMSMSM
mmetsp:Transcript_8566/g.18032  ORF Transcript_8566/g.18032 Transcript_8566/m.18032 type:complete len:99 (-) Transcript_8566:354-650(-)|eukprot:CAMPEP_0171327832 /NCGR_PEP_ID=MMETSP0878-20121228/267_1 /TAXON_ID=67004 /ORGANISM="Thalassiosira weissflogii, Strain CCMP1336" /LENGTH=98 /DNA_ID=CAMNT_0011827633 /DNA_START=89 /DNA_END=385 /DNA_ORIENTATION=-